MKNARLFTLVFLGASLLFPAACRHLAESPGYCSDKGAIIGFDYRKCICCGGWFMEIEGDTLRAPMLPADFTENIDFDEFPLPVLLEWSRVPDPCLGDEIEVDCIRRR